MPTAWPARGPRSSGGAGSFPKVRGRSVAGQGPGTPACCQADVRTFRKTHAMTSRPPSASRSAPATLRPSRSPEAGGAAARGTAVAVGAGAGWAGVAVLLSAGEETVGETPAGGWAPESAVGAGAWAPVGAGTAEGLRSWGPSGRGFGGDRIAGRACCRDRRCLGFWTVRGRRADQRGDDPSDGVAGGASGRQCEDQGTRMPASARP